MNRDSSAARPARRDSGEADARDVRELILDATEGLLAARRFESLSVAEILDAARVSRGSFYFYFANKHAVLAELVRRAVASGRDAAGAWIGDASGAPEAALRQGTAEGTRQWRAHGPVLRAIVENWQSDPALTRLWTETMDAFTTIAAERIRADRAAGTAPDTGGDPQVLAAILCWMNERAWYLAAIGHPGFGDDARLTDALTRIWQSAVYGTQAGT